MKDPKHVAFDTAKSYAYRQNEAHWKNEHTPLDTQVGRKAYQARTKNAPIQPFRYQAEVNAGKAQKNMPENYTFNKKEW